MYLQRRSAFWLEECVPFNVMTSVKSRLFTSTSSGLATVNSFPCYWLAEHYSWLGRTVRKAPTARSSLSLRAPCARIQWSALSPFW